LMWIAKDWADPAIPAKGRTVGSKFGIKLPARHSKYLSFQMCFSNTEGGFA